MGEWKLQEKIVPEKVRDDPVTAHYQYFLEKLPYELVQSRQLDSSFSHKTTDRHPLRTFFFSLSVVHISHAISNV